MIRLQILIFRRETSTQLTRFVPEFAMGCRDRSSSWKPSSILIFRPRLLLLYRFRGRVTHVQLGLRDRAEKAPDMLTEIYVC